MNNPCRLENLAKRLRRAGAEEAYVQRLTEELSEHYREHVQSSIEEGAAEKEAEAVAAVALGSNEEIATEAVRRLRSGAWFGRHRVACLGLVALVLYPLSAVLLASIWVGLGTWLTRHGVSKMGAAAHVWKFALEASTDLVLPVAWFLGASWFCRRYLYGRGFSWALCGAVFAWAVDMSAWATLPMDQSEKGKVVVGLAVSLRPMLGAMRGSFLAGFLCVVIGSLMARRRMRPSI